MRLYEFDQPRAAGCVLYAEDTGRWCLQQRSTSVSDPGVWSTWGGGVAPGETLKDAVRRELAEESGYTGPLRLEPLMMGQRYATYIGHVPHEFKPRLNFESQDYRWVEAGSWPSPLHPGLRSAMSRVDQLVAEGSLSEKINPKTLTRGFVQEKDLGWYTLQAVGDFASRMANEPPTMQINAMLKPEAGKGQVTQIGQLDLKIAHGMYLKNNPGAEALVAGGVWVDDVYQRKGVASAMYAFAKELGNDVIASVDQSDDAKAMWAGMQAKGVAENFADGKNPGRKGLSRRVGIPKKPSLTQLSKIAKSSTGERRRMAQWQLNMRRGKARKNK